MPDKALMEFQVPNREIGCVEEFSHGFLEARTEISKKYDKKVDCTVNLGHSRGDKPTIYVELKEVKDGNLKPALQELFQKLVRLLLYILVLIIN